ncbi:MAG: DJ-1 family glyoxalase III [Marinifilaceae bacterium]
MQQTFLFLADGFEEIEALAVVDILRRGNVNIETVSITSSMDVKGAHGISVKADRLLSDITTQEAECLILPGGMPGAQHLCDCPDLVAYVQRHVSAGRLTAAICAAPALVLGKIDFGKSMHATCYPSFEKFAPNLVFQKQGVVVDDFLITGRGPAYAVDFGLTILTHLHSQEVADSIASGMLLSEKYNR